MLVAMRADATSFDEPFRRRVREHVKGFGEPIDRLALVHLATALGLAIAGLGAHAALWSRLQTTLRDAAAHPVPTAGLLLAWLAVVGMQVGANLKLFMIHHDLMHGAFFTRSAWHRPLAVLVGSLIHVSPTTWKREHDRHHRTSNDLDRPQDGQTASLTVDAYRAAPWWLRLAYRIGNDPWLLFTVVPLFYFVLYMRVRARWYENVVAFAWWLALWKLGLVWNHLIPMTLAAILGFIMFHAQHTFDGAYRRRSGAWDFIENGLLGSSLLVLPGGALVAFFAHGVEYHHAHHLNPAIPGYRLARCHREAGSLFDACPRVTLRQALRTLHYNLYDESTGRFADMRRLRR